MSALRVFSSAEANFLFHRLPKIAEPFPRRKVALFAFVCLLWLCFGILARDPWKPTETKLVAVIADMAVNGMDLSPQLPTELHAGYPPLYLWLATLSARLFSEILPLHEGARIANIALLAAALWLTGRAAHLFYGSRIAWLTALLAIGAAGFMIRGHLLNFGVPAFFGMAAAIYGIAVLTGGDKRQFKTLSAAAVTAAAVVFLLYAVGTITAAAAAFVVLIAFVRARNITAIGVVAFFIMPFVLAWTAANEYTGLWRAVTDKWGGISLATLSAEITDMMRVAAWSLFPLLPLAFFGLYFERERHRSLFVCAWSAVVVAAGVFLLIGNEEEDYFLILPPLAILAARALQVLPEDAARVLDFFALLVVGLCFIGGLWLVWCALVTGYPSQLAAYLAMYLPGYALPPVGWLAVVVAAILTVGWAVLASNFGHSNERAGVNWCTGVTLVWVIFNLLLAGYVDSGKSYRHLAAAIAGEIGSDCLRPDVDSHLRAQLYYFDIALGGADCRYRLSTEAADNAVWHGSRRPGDTVYYLQRKL